jgi:polysaccharide pyruvyl transferase WcaK-like protein
MTSAVSGQASVEDVTGAPPRARTIQRSPVVGLLTPYCGGNLGDAAIHEASIRAILDAYPSADVYGLTLFPAATGAAHGIRAYPLNGYSLEHYPVILRSLEETRRAVAPEGAASASPQVSVRTIVKGMIGLVPPLFSVIRWIRNAIQLAARESAHLARAVALARRSDLIIVNGGGQLDDYFGGAWAHPYVLFKWGLLARLTRTPYVILSVGVCNIDARDSRLSRFFFRRALSFASYRSYRDEKSRAIAVARLGASAEDPVVPDLAFGLSVERRRVPVGAGTVAISPIAHRDPRWWDKADVGEYREYLRIMAEFVATLLARGHRVRWYTTATPDEPVIADILALIPPALRRAMPNPAVPTTTLASAIAVLRESDLVVASRLHGVVLAHLMHCPVLALSYDPKVETHMRDMGQLAHSIDITAIDATRLFARFESLRANAAELRASLVSITARNADRVRRQMQDALEMTA